MIIEELGDLYFSPGSKAPVELRGGSDCLEGQADRGRELDLSSFIGWFCCLENR